VLATFVADDALLAPAGATRVAYLAASLRALDAELDGALHVRHGEPAAALGELAASVGARTIVATADYAPYGRRRDLRVAARLAAAGVEVLFVDSPYAVAPGTLHGREGRPLRVFSAFHRAWLAREVPDPLAAPHPGPWRRVPGDGIDLLALAARRVPDRFAGLPAGPAPELPPAGERAARTLLDGFATRVERYDELRDRPGADGTSRLSAALRFGALHPRQVLAELAGDSRARERLVAELAWREFYADVLWHHPASAREDLSAQLRGLRVDTGPRARERFRAWALGQTGFPLVDAGMRQLLREGWMHNRVRMVSASFLVKHLHLDWRWGARWFMWRLVDGDLASNQHGWQWVAGTGTDAAPFHRVFNPTLQAERFDPDGVYVRRYVGELAALAAPACLAPGGGPSASGYPAPLVDAASERREALARLARARAVRGAS
jgi:deoxyribodipyrimidine photo-lyase